jgi:hypothetical protein
MSAFRSHSTEVVLYVSQVILVIDSECSPFQPYGLVFLVEANCVLCEAGSEYFHVI